MDIPIHDTPSLALLRSGHGGAPDPDALRDCMQVLRVAKRLLGHFYTRFSAHDISPGKYSVLTELLALPEGTSLSPSQLAEKVGVRRPTMTGLIDGLCRQGFVQRAPAPGDRRQVAVQLSPKGAAFMHEFLPGQFAAMSAVVSPLDAGERGQLRGLLAKLEEGLR